MSPRVITPELRSRILALRLDNNSSTAIAEQLGLKPGTVRGVCHAALARGEVPPLATRRGDPKAARIPNSLPGRLRKAPGRPGYIVEGGRV